MVQVDLITGFLGAGKTTFIHRYIDYFSRQGKKVHVIENEFGGIGVDARMLQEDDCEISDLSGVCMCCTGKELFKRLLVQGAENGCDRILVEPSGIYDVDEFFSVMLTCEVRECCEIGSILTIVDGHMEKNFSDEAKYLMFCQLLAAGKVVMSKTQMFPESTIQDTLAQMNRLMEERGSRRRFGTDVCIKPWDQFSDGDFHAFTECGYQFLEHNREMMQHDLVFQVKEMADYCKDQQDLEKRLRSILSDPIYGTVLRIKGHIQDMDKNWYELNCCRDGFSVRPCQVKRGIYEIIGQDLNEKELNKAFISRRSVKLSAKQG